MIPISHTFRLTPTGKALFYGWFEAMHSRLDLLLLGQSETEATALSQEIATETLRIERLLNRFDAESPVSQINQPEAYSVYGASPELLTLFEDADRYRCATQGAFDIAIQTPGFCASESYYTVDRAREAIIKLRPEVCFDFGGYAKGYALAQIKQRLQRVGVSAALVSFGNSSIYGIGHHPAGDCWQVGVEHPLQRGVQMGTFALRDSGLSSSGNTPRNRGHIRSSESATPLTLDRVVSVCSPDPLECEVLSTALFAANPVQQGSILDHFRGCRFTDFRFTAQHSTMEELRPSTV
ncbi:MAG: FAD:protein FMN transferase [Alistipes sp.]|nr:FAD:protein FMN transferase [Alistipes sp.]